MHADPDRSSQMGCQPARGHTRPTPPRLGLATIVIAAMLLTACGDDSDAASTTTQADTIQTTRTEPTSTDADPATFCQAHLDAEATNAPASNADDATVEAALDEFAAAAPPELQDTVTSMIELAMSGQEDTPEFEAAYGELLGYVATNCDHPEVGVTASDYAYEGIPDNIGAGPTLLALDNTGAELHHIVVFRVNDGVTDTLEELAAQSHDGPGSKMTPVSSATAPPGQTGHALLLLEPGRHVAFCFIPTGATPENLPKIESGELEGAPHYEHGMLAEFTVS